MFGNIVTMELAHTPIWRWLLFFVCVLSSLVVGRLARFLMLRAANRMDGGEKEWLSIALKSLSRPVIFVCFSTMLAVIMPLGILTIPPIAAGMTGITVRVLLAASVGWLVYSLVDVVDHFLAGIASRTQSKVDDMLVPLVGKSIRVTVLVVVILLVVDQVSQEDITSILAGLGIGGIALALAAQDTLKNFFGSLVIIGDKPFEIGDRVIMDGHDGPVESVGFRSTKIRTLAGHLVTVPNSEVATRTIQNIGKRPFIKRMANITITYDTPPAKVERALDIIKDILKDHEGMDPEFPPRVYFNEFNDWSLNILVIYWYSPPDYWEYMAFSEHVNQQILERFNSEGIEFAFPTQTLYHANCTPPGETSSDSS